MSDFFLQIISGVQVGKKIKVGEKLALGRAAENDICFSGADGTLVSGRHAVLERQGETLVLRDLGSTNGTYVNGEAVTERVLRPDEIFSLGVSGPKLRLLDRALGGVGDATALKAPARASIQASPLETKLARTEFEPRRSGPVPNGPAPRSDQAGRGGKGFPGDRGRLGGDIGDYTMGLAQRLKDDEAGHDEFQGLIKDKDRAERIAKSGMISKRDARMIQSAAATYSAHRKRGWIILASVSGVAAIIVGVLLYQNMGYRGKLKQQERLLGNVQSLETQLAEAKQTGSGQPDEEKAVLVAKLRAAERQLTSVQSNLRSKDLITTYKNPLGREIHTIMAGFGKADYIVPDIFINQVEKHIYSFTKTSTRSIIERSLRNKDRYHKIIEDELARQSMPQAFLYLAMHESTLDNTIVSRTGARGLWQFMPQTARDYGLRVPENWQELPAEDDQRTDPALSTQAGVKYVKTLYAEFGDVALAMAAYNAGEGKIRKALRSIDDPINNRDFWYIYRMGTLADETNEYIPKIIATMIIDKNRERYGFEQ